MSLSKKYNYDISDMEVVKKLPTKPEKYLYILRPIEGEWYDDKLYRNEFGKLEIIAEKEDSFYAILLFLKKYRPHPELLPKDLKHEEYSFRNRSSDDIYKSMQLMLKPMNTFEEFKERLLLATEELAPKEKIEKGFIYGLYLIFINDKDEMGKKTIDMHDKEVPWEYETYVYINKDKQTYEIYYPEERSNRYSLEIKFYEEHYIYEYLLNKKISAII